MSRKVIITYLIFLFIFSVFIYFFIRYRQNHLFSSKALESIISTPSQWRTKYLSPCDAIISGDPNIGDNWVKISFHCPQGVKNSTFATTVLREKSWKNTINEYARIIGFPPSEVFDEKKWTCYLGRKILINNQSKVTWDDIATKKGSIDCLNPEYTLNYLIQYYGIK
ncbi:MAG: hypothetical protein US68_C0008G0076 [Candidatus Shapirobacteria bacterium GW2011_GWE1_38_10]|uniref:Uncharacterized protein n=1 Tax=Candidatus Shapirobacteria bacterium GW2011_GWE1_38_10 TaxID=1618488 RepID=A0A0G0LC39_9BACT|nr:MAG: hypothetical protein US46_C0006G0069 [Candidatus Shapirobacteria bacterium GW2011_GWF2_37_20]KKQ50191.1 MAG: hypothetical protein US68_C0008G0076 [Candidatus Shapirobacteria bacterium GW2011_GWE1_38_10]KKQ63791.1 MAG: hypothetical protein US85_C0014G0023 [Candidatus Shapirobacteria bacterium GW2011_GWF1_38_23]HBP51434.1 hypothetical protein [Candidatus Shapirobacteria bacterium]